MKNSFQLLYKKKILKTKKIFYRLPKEFKIKKADEFD